ncbi:RnfH family protein [Pantoea sp. SoEX]|uniref:RnfH family protein n=1 Tax=Pantoea sp. SoEX TaxID=2576763 RepID=UPI00135C9112|nr:RnfH family protein [Pantoea sp. SoEX]MXP50812.1 RnfH family protein [Pantoea sp. SoEX]
MNFISVELIYAFPKKYYHFFIKLNNYSTVRQVIETSGILNLHNEINIYSNKIGIHGKSVNLEYMVKDGDRIEIYRPLSFNPIELRRQKAKISRK